MVPDASHLRIEERRVVISRAGVRTCRGRFAVLMAGLAWWLPGLASGAEKLCDDLAQVRDPAVFIQKLDALKAATGETSPEGALATCGLDYAQLKYEHCQRAFRRQDLDYLLQYCPEQAWSTARAQCERTAASVSPGFTDFCHKFYTGTAPTYGK